MLCEEKEAIHLFIVCVHGHDIILKNMKDINLRTKSFFLACKSGHASTISILLKIVIYEQSRLKFRYLIRNQSFLYSLRKRIEKKLPNNAANFYFCKENGIIPLYLSSQNRNERTVQL